MTLHTGTFAPSRVLENPCPRLVFVSLTRVFECISCIFFFVCCTKIPARELFRRVFECTCRITLYTDNTYDSWFAHDTQSRSERRRKTAPLPKGAEGAKEARPCEPTRTGARQGPAAASSCQRSCPAAAAGLRAAGTGNGHREGWLEPRTSPDNVLRKHEGCDEESARWRVQGALEQLGRRGALVSGWAA